MSVEEITLAESLRTQSAKQFERLREINKIVNLQNIELRNFQKKKSVSLIVNLFKKNIITKRHRKY